ncbi:MAG TPA: class I SAM-dependent methyltransferase family protein [Pyrodictium sp.]|nr:class I SAM-dependent methyltransferase family protein [Pyrodictium sp.]HIQ55209.1 class I SAM-dependent methyltransferase family protein [Pyrodictium sp.]
MTKSLIRKIAEQLYGPEKAKKFWQRLEIIGDIAVVRQPFDVSLDELKPLAEKILEELPYVKSVWAAVSPVEGQYRLRKFVHLAGERRSETVYKEHGCLFKLDITRVYVSPRLGYEHVRVAKLVEPGEVVVNMYAGAGLFSIIIARYAKPKKVYSIDINPDAYRYMVENVKLNRVENIVEPILGDAVKVIEERLVGVADRVLMPLPELALQHLPYAIKALREDGKGIIHVYLHVHASRGEDPIEKSWRLLVEKLDELGIKAKRLFGRIVRDVGPRWYQVVLDVRVLKRSK